MTEYELRHEVPDVESYCALRIGAGMSPKSAEAAARSLTNTLWGVTIHHDGAPVGMGRMLGDGGGFYFVTDICVLPQHQLRGLGSRIMTALMDEFHRVAPPTAYCTLIADGDAVHLYEKFGFQHTAPEAIGMYLRVPEDGDQPD